MNSATENQGRYTSARRAICRDYITMRALCRSRLGFPRETAGEWLERVSQAKRQSRSPRSKAERAEIPGDGTGERRYIVPVCRIFDMDRHV